MKKQTDLIELTNFDSGKTEILTRKECEERFGKAEFNEILLGYLPNYAAIEI